MCVIKANDRVEKKRKSSEVNKGFILGVEVNKFFGDGSGGSFAFI